ncbi:MAG: LAGLIDADG family homing endonuclease, partial [Candidatus Nanohaloarchaea archaeon]
MPTSRRSSTTSSRRTASTASEFASFLESLEPAILGSSGRQRVPAQLFRTAESIRAAFLRAYVEGEGHVSTTERELTVASTSRELLEDVRTLLLSLGIRGHLEEKRGGSFRLRISGGDFQRYVDRIGFVTERKKQAAAVHDGTVANTNTDVIPDVGPTLRTI